MKYGALTRWFCIAWPASFLMTVGIPTLPPLAWAGGSVMGDDALCNKAAWTFIGTVDSLTYGKEKSNGFSTTTAEIRPEHRLKGDPPEIVRATVLGSPSAVVGGSTRFEQGRWYLMILAQGTDNEGILIAGDRSATLLRSKLRVTAFMEGRLKFNALCAATE